MTVPKQLGASHFPGMEDDTYGSGEYHLGIGAVGACVIENTIAFNTEPTVAEMAASPSTRTGIVAAGAVVREGQEIPPFSIAAGVPAAVVGRTGKEHLAECEERANRYRENALRHVREDLDRE